MRTKIQWRPKMIFHRRTIYLRLWLFNVDPLWFTWQWALWLGSRGCFEHGHWALLFWRLVLSRYNGVLCVQERESSLNTKLHEHRQSKVCRVNKENAGVVEISLCSTWWHVWNSLFCAGKQHVPGPGRGQCLSEHLASEKKEVFFLGFILKTAQSWYYCALWYCSSDHWQHAILWKWFYVPEYKPLFLLAHN